MPPTGIVKTAKSQESVLEGLAPCNRRLMTIEMARTRYVRMKIVVHTDFILGIDGSFGFDYHLHQFKTHSRECYKVL